MIPSLSIVIPVYNSASTLPELFASVTGAAASLSNNYECIFVDDGSTDGSFTIMKNLRDRYPFCTVLSVTENRGQQNALLCGFHFVTKEFIVTMDDDLAHNPHDISVLYAELREKELDLVYGVYPLKREHPRRFGSNLTDRFFRRFCGKPIGVKAGSFRMLRRKILHRICIGHPKDRPFIYITAASLQITGNVSSIELGPPAAPGAAGSRYSLCKLIGLFLRLFIYYSGFKICGFFQTSGPPYTLKTIYPQKLPSDDPASSTGEKKKILFLGSGNNQVYPIRRGRELGYYIIASDYFPSSEGKRSADAYLIADAFSPEKTFSASAWIKPDGILTTGTDQTVLTMAKVAEKLNLPCYISSETAVNVTNKRHMKELLKKHSIPINPFAYFSGGNADSSLHRLTSPYVTKPVDSQGQRGVYKLNTLEEVYSAYPSVVSYSRENCILLEEYYESDEITVSGWVTSGSVTILSVTDRVTFENGMHIGICSAHDYPSKYAARYRKEIEELTKKLVSVFAVTDGPIYVQFLVGNEGIRVNEVACRIGGAYEDIFIPECTGFDILAANYLLALGEEYSGAPFPGYDWAEPSCYLSSRLFFALPGKVRSLRGMDEVRSRDSVLAGEFHIREGEEIEYIQNATARAGYVIVVAESRKLLRKEIAGVFSILEILDKDGNNLIVPS